MLMLVVEALEIVPLSCLSGGGLLGLASQGGRIGRRPGCSKRHTSAYSSLHSFIDPPDPPCRDAAWPSRPFRALLRQVRLVASMQVNLGAECHSCCSVNPPGRAKSTHVCCISH